MNFSFDSKFFGWSFLSFLAGSSLAWTHPREISFSLGQASYQFEGAGPGSNIWESKPTYASQPYAEILFRQQLRTGRSFASKYNQWKLSLLGGQYIREHDQDIERKLESAILRVGWGWTFPAGVGFEVGPMAFGQWHELRDVAMTETQHYQFLRLGSYFSGRFNHAAGPWRFDFLASIGVAGMPQRQSAASEWSFSARRYFNQGWWIGAKALTALIQIERKDNFVADVGTVSDAIVMFRQGETDFDGVMLEFGMPIK